MYGFPQELYEVVYPAKGDSNLTKEVQKLLDNSVSINGHLGHRPRHVDRISSHVP